MKPQLADDRRVGAPFVAVLAVLAYLAYYLVAGHADRLCAALLPAFS
jgi:hypothetical protein